MGGRTGPRAPQAAAADRLTFSTLSPMRVGDLRFWIFVAVVFAIVGFLIYATVAAGGI